MRWSAARLPRAHARGRTPRPIEGRLARGRASGRANALFVRAGDADPLVFTTWRLWFALPPLAAVLLVAHPSRRRGDAARARRLRGRWVLLVFGAGAFFASGAATAFAAIDKTRLLDVTLIGALQPVVIIVVAVLFLGEHVERTSRDAGAHRGGGDRARRGCRRPGSGTWSMAGEVIAVVSLFLNAGWYLYGRVLRGRYAIDPFGVHARRARRGGRADDAGRARLRRDRCACRRRPSAGSTATMLFGTSAHLLLVWAHRYVPASLSAPLLLAEPAARRGRRLDLLRRGTRPGRDRRLTRRRRRAARHGPQPGGHPRRGRRSRPGTAS